MELIRQNGQKLLVFFHNPIVASGRTPQFVRSFSIVNIKLMRAIGGIRVGSVISLRLAKTEVGGIGVPEALTRPSGLTIGVVALEIGSTEICPVRVTFVIAPDIPYRTCGA